MLKYSYAKKKGIMLIDCSNNHKIIFQTKSTLDSPWTVRRWRSWRTAGRQQAGPKSQDCPSPPVC